ncbi:hypothetical protein HOK76_03075 [archaeon]|nr:hypothetical protein [archaeon]
MPTNSQEKEIVFVDSSVVSNPIFQQELPEYNFLTTSKVNSYVDDLEKEKNADLESRTAFLQEQAEWKESHQPEFETLGDTEIDLDVAVRILKIVNSGQSVMFSYDPVISPIVIPIANKLKEISDYEVHCPSETQKPFFFASKTPATQIYRGKAFQVKSIEGLRHDFSYSSKLDRIQEDIDALRLEWVLQAISFRDSTKKSQQEVDFAQESWEQYGDLASLTPSNIAYQVCIDNLDLFNHNGSASLEALARSAAVETLQNYEDGNFYKLIDDKNRKRVTAISYHQVELFDELRQADDRWVEGDDNSDHGPIVDELIGWTIGRVRYLVEKFEKKMEWERRQGNIPKGEYEIFAEKIRNELLVKSLGTPEANIETVYAAQLKAETNPRLQVGIATRSKDIDFINQYMIVLKNGNTKEGNPLIIHDLYKPRK